MLRRVENVHWLVELPAVFIPFQAKCGPKTKRGGSDAGKHTTTRRRCDGMRKAGPLGEAAANGRMVGG